MGLIGVGSWHGPDGQTGLQLEYLFPSYLFPYNSNPLADFMSFNVLPVSRR